MTGALAKWLKEETYDQEAVSSNPSAAYKTDYFSHFLVAKMIENKRERGRG